MANLFNPALNLGRNTVYVSTVVSGDLDTAAKVERVNAAIAELGVQTVVFDKAVAVTMPRSSNVGGSANNIFVIPSGRKLVGDPTRPIDCTSWDTSSVAAARNKFLFRAQGTEGGAVNLSASLPKGVNTLMLSSGGAASAGIVRGSQIRITSNKVFIAGGTASTECQGEIAFVVDVTGDQVTFCPPAQDTYLTTDTARVHKLNMAKGISFEGVSAIGPGMLSDGATPRGGDKMLHMILCDGLRIDDMTSDFFDGGNSLYSCINGYSRGLKYQFETNGARERDQIQYGFCLTNACQDFIVEGSRGIGGKHGIVQSESGTAMGVTRRCAVRDNLLMSTWSFAIATHTNAELWSVEGNTIDGCWSGIEAGCRSAYSRNNTIRNLLYRTAPSAISGTGIAVAEVAEDFASDGDKVYGGGFGIRFESSGSPGLMPGSVGPTKFKINNFYAESSNQDAIRILWSGIGNRFDFELVNINTRNIGQPVDAAGRPTTGAATGASSIDIRGNAGNALERVKIAGANLQGWAGNTAACAITQYCTGIHASDISYANHGAPSIGTTATVTDNNNEFGTV